MLEKTSTDPIESTHPTLRRDILDLAARCLYDLVRPPAGLYWDDLSDGQRQDYRRRILRAAMDTDRIGTCPSSERIAAWVDGGLSDYERGRLIEHGSGCPTCLQLIADAIGRQVNP